MGNIPSFISDLKEILPASIILFLVMDPLGNIPIFLSCLKHVEDRRRPFVIWRESCIALGILLFFLLLGPSIMHWLNIGPTSLQLTGGLLLFLIAVGMVFPGTLRLSGGNDANGVEEPLIVPLATPAVAGPSTIATIMILASKSTHPLSAWVAALVISWTATTLVLLLAPRLSRWLGARGLAACERLMGVVLAVIAVQMILDGIVAFVKLLRQGA
jgi:MarC family membrane protein